MDIPLDYLPWLIAVVFGVLAIVIIYELKLKPTYQLPLANEEDMGIGKIHLPQLGRFNEGRITTARNTVAGQLGKEVTNAPEEKQAGLMAIRKALLETKFFLAQRIGTSKIMYMFDTNPLDPRYCLREDKGAGTPIHLIGPVQDCFSKGSNFGFEWISVKLSTERAEYTPEMLQHDKILLEAMEYGRDAASNLVWKKFLEDRVKTLEAREGDWGHKLSTVTSDKDEIETSSNLQSLNNPAPIKTGRSFGPAVKSWFGDWKQLVAAAFGYLVLAPVLISNFVANATPPTTNYLTVAITTACFFSIPFFKKVPGLNRIFG